jgi:hypothetical protein
MIFVKRITGESFDLETGSQLPKAIVLSNGASEVSISVNDEDAMAVVQLMVDSAGSKEPTPLRATSAEPKEEPRRSGHVLDLAREIQEASGEYDDPDTGTTSI